MDSYTLFQILQEFFPLPVDYTGINMTINAPSYGEVEFSYTITSPEVQAEAPVANPSIVADGIEEDIITSESTTGSVTTETITETPVN